MGNQEQNLAQGVRSGGYLLYKLDKEGFDKIRPQLSGDDHFLHDVSKYPHPKSFGTISDTLVYVWMHYGGESGSSNILGKMSPDRTGEMEFLQALNTGIRLDMDKSGGYTSSYPRAKFAGNEWRHDVLDTRVDLEKLSQPDFKIKSL